MQRWKVREWQPLEVLILIVLAFVFYLLSAIMLERVG